jgi:competence protein ComEC
VIEVAAGRRFVIGDATVEVLAPPAAPAPGAERNSRSIVLRVVGRHGSMLLTGDADRHAQLRLLRRPAALRADVLKVPHHGGATNAVGFIDAVAARVAVVSVGAGNSYGHPHPDTVADLAPVPLWRTDRHGAVTVTLTPAGPVVQPAPPGTPLGSIMPRVTHP